nr:2-oxoacid:acceptor oxidoreductase family protein [Candidatus Omnitrophota bacterium]
MSKIDLTIKIGGAAGQGLQTIGQVLSKVFARQGYYVFACQALESRIRGGHNWYQIRISDEPVFSPSHKTDILIALDKESVYHEKELSGNSITVFDSSISKVEIKGCVSLDIPLTKIAADNGGNKIMANTVATAAVLGLLESDIEVLFDMIRKNFADKAKEVIDVNIKVAQAGYDHVFKKIKENQQPCLKKIGEGKMLLGGSEAVALGALAAGCQFICAYPMSPSTDIMVYLATKEKYGILVEQSEDEIASINISLGASFAGVRSMTATSGGGFALMVEGISLSAMTETPIVVVLAQ